jgi:hypothetical protein
MGPLAMMNPTPRRIVSQRHFMWLLWLALLLPMGQLLATWHALSHANSEARGEVNGKQALHLSHCDLCLTAAAVAGGAMAVAPPSLPHAVVRHQAPQRAFESVWLESPARAYRSRAPPFAPH